MASTKKSATAGEELVSQDLITREDLDAARAHEAATGKPWYRQLLDTGKVSFHVVEDTLRYEFHSSGQRAEHAALGDALVSEGILSKDNLQRALVEHKRTGRLLGRILVEHKFITPDDKARVLAKQYGLEFTVLSTTPSTQTALDKVPKSMARKNNFLPVSIEGDRLTVLITDPQTRGRLEEVSVMLGLRIHPILTGATDLQDAIHARYTGEREDYAIQSEAPGRVITKKVNLTETLPPASPVASASETEDDDYEDEEEMEEEIMEEEVSEVESKQRFEAIAHQASGTSVVRMVATIIEGAVNSGATDVHLDPQDPEMRVRYRIDGILHDVMSIPEKLEGAIVSRIKIMSDLDITNSRLPQDGHISMDIGDREFDVRVASLPTYLGERVVLRLLDQSSVLSGIRDLGLEKDDEAALNRSIEQPYGMVLVTGPTGSGKTTTLYASLNQKNVMTDSIVTLEDPVEYQLSGINQVQIDPDIDLTFANTLRAALRQDIDVLLVGEIRDAETARIAIRAAMTGHLVFSTLHTNDAPEAISTLRNMDVPAYLMASALTSIVGQRLVRTICDNCQTYFKPTPTLLKSIGLPAATKRLYRGKGCDLCFKTGNRGRTGIFEILEISGAVREQIAQDADPNALAKAAKLKTMAMRCRQKVKDGIVTPEEFLRVIRT